MLAMVFSVGYKCSGNNDLQTAQLCSLQKSELEA